MSVFEINQIGRDDDDLYRRAEAASAQLSQARPIRAEHLEQMSDADLLTILDDTVAEFKAALTTDSAGVTAHARSNVEYALTVCSFRAASNRNKRRRGGIL